VYWSMRRRIGGGREGGGREEAKEGKAEKCA
jgi:hypothetical protein